MTALGRAIEDDSFAIVDREVGPHAHPPEAWELVRRLIHATADFEFRDLTVFSPDALAAAKVAVRRGAPVVADVKMIAVGANAARLAQLGSAVHTYIDEPDVIARAREGGTTRAVEAMRAAARAGLLHGGIAAVGNAPTALLEIVRLHQEEGVTPAFVIGMPVGFVNAAESKELLLQSGLPCVITRGRKGGSTLTVAALHALLHIAAGDLR